VELQPLEGGVTAAAGFRAAGVACGLKRSGLDLAIVAADRPVSAAGLFTTNRAQAAPVLVSKRHLAASGGRAVAVVINSGCANACTGPEGEAAAEAMAEETARRLGAPPELVLVASTGVIGVALDRAAVARGIAAAVPALARERHAEAARAIMTTDRVPKEAAVCVPLGPSARAVTVGGMAKGAGMIAPDLATMLAVVTTDAGIDPPALRAALARAAERSFNAVTVDGDRSTNDTVFALASGASGVTVGRDELPAFQAALDAVCTALARAIARDGEGATKFVTVRVTGAATAADARRAARAVADSLLVKTAVYGGDPNWGRLVAAAGRSGAAFDLGRARVRIGPAELFAAGRPFDERAPEAAAHLAGRDVELEIDLGAGGAHTATMWTCDLTPEYVRINGEYRT
jgi:glutamate N-acetyltransferase/amino-acid N-acetyltransferase